MKKNCYDYEIVSKNPIAWLYNHDDTVKKVKIIDCDFNKHVDMVCVETGEEWSYKWGYVYPTEESTHKAIANTKAWLADEAEYESVDCIDPWKMLLSNKDYSKYKKLKRKEKLAENKWFVAVNDDSYSTSKKFTALRKAAKYFDSLDHDSYEFIALGENNRQDCNFIEWENGQLWIIDQGRKTNFHGAKYRTFKSFHLGKNPTYKQWRK